MHNQLVQDTYLAYVSFTSRLTPRLASWFDCRSPIRSVSTGPLLCGLDRTEPEHGSHFGNQLYNPLDSRSAFMNARICTCPRGRTTRNHRATESLWRPLGYSLTYRSPIGSTHHSDQPTRLEPDWKQEETSHQTGFDRLKNRALTFERREPHTTQNSQPT